MSEQEDLFRQRKREAARRYRETHPGRANEASKQWAKTHPDKNREKAVQWRKKNPQGAKEASARWRNAHPAERKERAAKWARENPEKKKEINARWVEKNLTQVKATKRARHLKRFYNLTQQEYDVKLIAQKGLCAICRVPCEKLLGVDHDHATKKARGLLCDLCNRGLGMFKESPQVLRRALNYLAAWNHEERAEWPRVMLDIATAAASRSRDSSTQVGAVVCSEGWRILSTGYNGPPAGSPNSLPMAGPEKHNWVIHAEINAISQAVATLGNNDLTGCRLFSTHRPCGNCLRLASHHGIKELSYGLDELSEEQTAVAQSVALTLGLRVTPEGEVPLT